MKLMKVSIGAAALGLMIGGALGALATGVQAADDHPYIGIQGCTSKCHKKEADGDQRTAWQNSKHAQAFKNLGTEEARSRAAGLGLDGDPQKMGECLICHTTGHGAESSRFDRKFDMADGVQCENCHGAGGDYKKKAVMVKITEELGPDKTGNSPTAESTGLHLPNEQTCKQCHVPQIERNGKTYVNPSYKDFDYAARVKEIAHNKP